MNLYLRFYNYLLITSFNAIFSNCRFFLPLFCQISLFTHSLLLLNFLLLGDKGIRTPDPRLAKPML